VSAETSVTTHAEGLLLGLEVRSDGNTLGPLGSRRLPVSLFPFLKMPPVKIILQVTASGYSLEEPLLAVSLFRHSPV
jgi:hypothetical protein